MKSVRRFQENEPRTRQRSRCGATHKKGEDNEMLKKYEEKFPEGSRKGAIKMGLKEAAEAPNAAYALPTESMGTAAFIGCLLYDEGAAGARPV